MGFAEGRVRVWRVSGRRPPFRVISADKKRRPPGLDPQQPADFPTVWSLRSISPFSPQLAGHFLRHHQLNAVSTGTRRRSRPTAIFCFHSNWQLFRPFVCKLQLATPGTIYSVSPIQFVVVFPGKTSSSRDWKCWRGLAAPLTKCGSSSSTPFPNDVAFTETREPASCCGSAIWCALVPHAGTQEHSTDSRTFLRRAAGLQREPWARARMPRRPGQTPHDTPDRRSREAGKICSLPWHAGIARPDVVPGPSLPPSEPPRAQAIETCILTAWPRRVARPRPEALSDTHTDVTRAQVHQQP